MIVTREDVFNKMVSQERPRCPHCNKEMVIWECPPMTFSDGLGWGTPFLYACFNDDCPLYVEGWKNISDNYGNIASYRCIIDPDSAGFECMPVFSREGGKGMVVDEQLKAEEEARKAAEKKGFAELKVHFDAADAGAIARVLFDEKQVATVRFEAATMIGEIGGLDVVEPIRNHTFGNEAVGEKANASANMILERNFVRECPFCAELVKVRAVVCKHCGKDLVEKQ